MSYTFLEFLTFILLDIDNEFLSILPYFQNLVTLDLYCWVVGNSRDIWVFVL